MGLFDRIKKAFTGRDDSEDKEKRPQKKLPQRLTKKMFRMKRLKQKNLLKRPILPQKIHNLSNPLRKNRLIKKSHKHQLKKILNLKQL
jgi:hypothetical protein